jgi:hypothetical protein
MFKTIVKYAAVGAASHYLIAPFLKGMRFGWAGDQDGMDAWKIWYRNEPRPKKS